MKFVVFGDTGRLGLIVDDAVLDLEAAAATTGRSEAPFGSLLELIEGGEDALTQVRSILSQLSDSRPSALFTPLQDVRLQAPWPGQRLAMAGANNADHVANCLTNMGQETSAGEVYADSRAKPPQAFWAIARPILGPDANVEIPARAKGFFDYEGEPAIVIGKRGKDIKAEDFSNYVWGVTQVIDWSVRDGVWPPVPQGPLVLGKNFDCSKSIGPCIVVGEVDIEEFAMETLVNNEVRQSFSVKEMIFSFAEILEYLSQDLTLHPGDVISGGTGAGTAIDTTRIAADGTIPNDRYLRSGDVVEVRSPALGSLVGRCVPKS